MMMTNLKLYKLRSTLFENGSQIFLIRQVPLLLLIYYNDKTLESKIPDPKKPNRNISECEILDLNIADYFVPESKNSEKSFYVIG